MRSYGCMVPFLLRLTVPPPPTSWSCCFGTVTWLQCNDDGARGLLARTRGLPLKSLLGRPRDNDVRPAGAAHAAACELQAAETDQAAAAAAAAVPSKAAAAALSGVPEKEPSIRCVRAGQASSSG